MEEIELDAGMGGRMRQSIPDLGPLRRSISAAASVSKGAMMGKQ